MTTSTFTILLRDEEGHQKEWELLATTPAQALMTATELCPQCEVIKIHLKGEQS